MKQSDPSDKLTRLLICGVLIILVLVPFHAFFTTWLGSIFGAEDLIKIWKELLLSVLAVFCGYIVFRDKELRTRFQSDLLFKLIGAYVLLHLLRGVVALVNNDVTLEALLFALIINLRFLVFFSVAYVVGTQSQWLHERWVKIVLWPAAVVIIFGLLQQFILPKDFLTHFGYGPDTIPAVATVDQKDSFTRLMSTTRGANPLGAYLVLITTAYVLLIRKQKYFYPLAKYSGTLFCALIIMVFTYSRSAWLGLILSLGTLLWVNMRTAKSRQYFAVACVSVAVAVGGILWVFSDNNTVQNSFFHTDETSTSAQSSNASRWQSFTSGVADTIREPLGRGPGTAGPASARTNNPRIAENYFVQIGQEIGVFGVMIFVAINVLAGQRLWRRRFADKLALVLFCSLLGITLINLLSHAWTDDTLALLWWGLAGIALSAPSAGILGSKHEQKANK